MLTICKYCGYLNSSFRGIAEKLNRGPDFIHFHFQYFIIPRRNGILETVERFREQDRSPKLFTYVNQTFNKKLWVRFYRVNWFNYLFFN